MTQIPLGRGATGGGGHQTGVRRPRWPMIGGSSDRLAAMLYSGS